MSDEERSPSTALHVIVDVLEGLDVETRGRVLKAVNSFFSLNASSVLEGASPVPTSERLPMGKGPPNFSAHNVPSAKEFLAQKQPRTDVERIACLAYYLTHYRETPFFKTLDLAKLNTEAAHPKFSNAAYAANNATNSGYLAPAAAGQRQISAAGEQFVLVLPDRDAAKIAMAQVRRRRAPTRKK